MTVAFCRAVAASETREEIKGPDYLAEIFLNEESKRPLKDPAAREWVLKNILTGGIYEYFIARTAYVDSIFLNTLNENIPQIVLLGAGYDTRGFRFSKNIKNTKIFELDSHPTQQRKIRLLNENKVPKPPALKFIPINFDTDNLLEKLTDAGFSRNEKTFFILEGVTYYLSREAVCNIFNFIKENSPSGSLLFFDYMLYSEERHNRKNIKEALERMKKTYTAESVRFMIDEGKAASLLAEYGFRIKDEVFTKKMGRYLTLKDGTVTGTIIDLFEFVLAEVK
jgi:methyltransferase (TIGR00027 family)